MKLSVTIPQIFYDLIARVLPGFLFLFVLNLELSGPGVGVVAVFPPSLDNSMVIVVNTLVYGILCRAARHLGLRRGAGR